MPDSFDYTTGTNSENVRLLQALIDDAPEYTEETNSRNANILKSIINNTEYTDAPQSEIEELLLRLKAKIGGEIEVDELNVTENGTYDAGVNKAYNPVKVELPLDSKTITENGTYTASDDNLAGYDEVTVAVEGYAKKSIQNTPTAIATFNASALPMPSLTVGIEATQDLHGYDSPWVGGAGKNKLPMTVDGIKSANTSGTWSDNSYVINGVTFTIQTDSDGNVIGVKANGTANATTTLFISTFGSTSGTSYILNGCPSNGSSSTYELMLTVGGSGTGQKAHDYGSGVSYTEDETASRGVQIVIRSGYNTQNLMFYPMIRLASVSDSTFVPYENICPISGHTEANVTRTGKNLFEHNSIAVYTYDFVTNSAFEDMVNPFFMKGGQTYVLTIDSGNKLYRMRAFDKNHDIITDMNKINAVNHGSTTGLTYYSTGKFYGYDGAGADNITVFRPTEDMWFDSTVQTTASTQNMLELGDTATTYEPYNGQTYTIDLDGTRYGCTLDVVSGVLTVDRVEVDLGSLNWLYSDSRKAFNVEIPEISTEVYSVMASCYAYYGTVTSASQVVNIPTGKLVRQNGNKQIFIKDDRYTDVTALKEAISGQIMVYTLDTSTTFDSTPTAVKSLLGTNNIWADTGDIQSGEYMEAL